MISIKKYHYFLEWFLASKIKQDNYFPTFRLNISHNFYNYIKKYQIIVSNYLKIYIYITK